MFLGSLMIMSVLILQRLKKKDSLLHGLVSVVLDIFIWRQKVRNSHVFKGKWCNIDRVVSSVLI